MASTGMKADDSGPTSVTALPEIDTSNNSLCGPCLQALTIDDQLAGGTTRVNSLDGTSTLDLSGFAHNDWETDTVSGVREGRLFDNRRKEHRDASGWTECDEHYDGPRKCTGQSRWFYASDGQERLVTPPRMLEISESAVGTCRFCSKLRALFIAQYSGHLWWNEPGSTLHFTIQYEWGEYRSITDGEDEAAIPPSWQGLQRLAVLVNHPGLTINGVENRPGLQRKKVHVFKFDVLAWPGPCKDWLKIRTQPLDPDGSASARNIDFMRRCIDKCISDHTECRKKATNPMFVPKRLLDIGDCSTDSARLVERGQSFCSSQPETQMQYATLSYCWGQSLPMVTVTANKYKHETTGIEIHRMPATFQDAIYVVRKLGIRYLWIDALCIVQDDKDDWEAEAITMCDIFAHSQITVSAARGSSSAESFLQRPAEETLDLHFHSALNPDILGQYSIRLQPRHWFPAEHDLEQSAWRSRAWVWQEEIMSTRQIVFANKALQFRCSKGIVLEDGLSENGSSLLMDSSSIQSWNNAMSQYSSRMLTYASDRLKAIAGVAKFIDDLNHTHEKPTRYLAGLWQNEKFGMQLCWVCKQPSLSNLELKGLLQDKEQYIAPSWSWASRNTGVNWLGYGRRNMFQVIRTDMRASHKSSMVSLAFGSSITISGKFRQTPVRPTSGRLVTDSHGLSHRWEVSSSHGCTEFWLDWVPNERDAKESEFERQLCLLWTAVFPGQCLGGLVIAPVLDPGGEVLFYHRVGAFKHWGISMLKSLPEQELTIR